MRAVVVDPDPSKEPFSVREWPDPVAAPGWAVVRVRNAALNRLDAMTVDERSTFPRPAVIGSDAAGVVQGVGAGVVDLDVSVGDEVIVLPTLDWGDRDDVQSSATEILGYPLQGTHAEYVAVPLANVFPKPERLTWDEAASLPTAGVTAWRALMSRGGLEKGETVVVTAASSGVGSLAIQIAEAVGARVVAVTSDEEKAEQARSLGASESVIRTAPDFARQLAREADGADLVLDSTGAQWPALVGALRPGGRMVVVGRKGADLGQLPVRELFWRQLSVMGSSMGSGRDFAALLAHLEAHAWAPFVDSVYPLEAVAAAYRRLDDPHRFGKVVLAP